MLHLTRINTQDKEQSADRLGASTQSPSGGSSH
jgi:hypothetical protein